MFLIDPMKWPPDILQAVLKILMKIPEMEDDADIGVFIERILSPLHDRLPKPLALLLFAVRRSPHMGLSALRIGVSSFSKRFVAGVDERTLMKQLRRVSRKGFSPTVAILGETVRSEEEVKRILDGNFAFIRLMSARYPGTPWAVAIKFSSLYSQINPAMPKRSIEKILKRASPFAREVKRLGGQIYLDAEEFEFRLIYRRVFEALYGEFGNTVRPVVQSYLKNSPETMDWLVKINRPEDPITPRLVRGAYWDYECFKAQEMRWVFPPVFTQKGQTDENFFHLYKCGWKNGLRVLAATHNVPSIIRIISSGLPILEFQMLYGMKGQVGIILRKKGYPMGVYLPTLYPQGNVLEAMPYLFRRVVENAAQLNFILEQHSADAKAELRMLREISDWAEVVK